MTTNEGQMLIRAFRFSQDFPAVLNLWSRSAPGVDIGRSDTPEEIAKKLHRDADLFLVAELDGKIVGAVIGGFDGRRGMAYHLAVSPTHRRRRIGTALMRELENRLRDKGCIRYYLMVVKDNHQAGHFYESFGLERMDVTVYGKNLD